MKGKFMREKLIIFTILVLACMFTSIGAVPLEYTGQIAIESKEVTSGTSFTIKINLTGNNAGLTSLRIPLRFDGQYLTCDYVDFGGSLKDPEMGGYYAITDDAVEISYIPPVVNPLPTIDAESGLLATLYFTIDNSAPDIIIAVDSLNEDFEFMQFGKTFHQWTRVEMTENDGSGSFFPAFVSGNLTVHQSTDVADGRNNLLPDRFGLAQNYPNPFNPFTIIGFSLPERARLRLEVFNVLGQSLAILADGDFTAGYHEVGWEASEVPSGIYFYRMTIENRSFTRKMLLLK